MEFPDLGKHCSESTCKQLDFLPMKCDACGKVFCREHFSYASHSCPKAYLKDVQVPVCPLCNSPVPTPKGDAPDFHVGKHIDNDCQSDSAKTRRKVFTNRCSLKGCRVKELVPVSCNQCSKNFCLRHRHPQDHTCSGPITAAQKARESALARLANSSAPKVPATAGKPPSRSMPPNPLALQGNMREDEALARALQASLQDSTPTANASEAQQREREDFLLAQAIAQSEIEARRRQQVTSTEQNKDRCNVS